MTLLYLNSDQMGAGDPVLGIRLLIGEIGSMDMTVAIMGSAVKVIPPC